MFDPTSLDTASPVPPHPPTDTPSDIEGGAGKRAPKVITDSLSLGDIITIKAPAYVDYHKRLFIVTYLDPTLLRIVNVSDADQAHSFNIHDGRFTEYDFEAITVVNASSEKGYARQNGLTQGVWVDVEFGGEVPRTYTAEITNLEEDMVELTTYPEKHVMYIDFAFRGIPRHIPIVNICVRDKPESARIPVLAAPDDTWSEANTADSRFPTPATRDASTRDREPDLEEEEGEELFSDQLAHIYSNNEDVVLGETLETIQVNVEINAAFQKYGIRAQVDDLLDACLATIPDYERTAIVMTDIRLLIQRYQELRAMYSTFDGDTVSGFLAHDSCPAAAMAATHKLPDWIIPVASQRKRLFISATSNQGILDIANTSFLENFDNRLLMSETLYLESQTPSDTIKYANMHNALGAFYQTTTPLIHPTSTIAAVTVPATTEYVLSTLPEKPFYASGITTVVEPIDPEAPPVPKPGKKGKGKTTAKGKGKGPKGKGRPVPGDDSDGEGGNGGEDEGEDEGGERETVSKIQVIQVPFMTSRAVEKQMYPHLEAKSSNQPSTFDLLIPGENIAWQSLLVFPSSIVRRSVAQTRGASIFARALSAADPVYKYDLLGHLAATNKWNTRRAGLPGQGKVTHAWNNVTHVTPAELVVDRPATRLESFLRSALPATSAVLTEYISVYEHPLAWSQVEEQLEAFGVFAKDLTHEHAAIIRTLLAKTQSTYRKSVSTSGEEFQVIARETYSTGESASNSTFLEQVFARSTHAPELIARVKKYYAALYHNVGDIQPGALGDDLSLVEILRYDRGSFLSTVIASDTTNLLTDVKEAPEYTPFAPDKVDVSCQNRVIAKKYTSTVDLLADNGREVFFDPTLDPTDYALGDQWRADHKALPGAPPLLDFFATKLTDQNPSAATKVVAQTAATLVAKARKVVDGEYALLELVPSLPAHLRIESMSAEERDAVRIEAEVRKKHMFYERKRNRWVHDVTLDDLSFADINDVVCGLQQTRCISRTQSQKSASPSVSSCESTRAMLLTERTKLLQEVVKRYDHSSEGQRTKLQEDLKQSEADAKNQKMFHTAEVLVRDISNWSRGKRVVQAQLVQSPFQRVLDAIMAKGVSEDSRHMYILRFVDQFCRAPYVADLAESVHWMYCIESGVKLVPLSQYTLAQAYRDGTYSATLAQLCAKGVRSNDGESIIDPHTGFVYRLLEFEEEFDIGVDAMGREEAEEKDWDNEARTSTVDMVAKTVTLPSGEVAAVYSDPVDQLNYNLLSVFLRHIGVHDAKIKSRAMSWCTHFGTQPRLVATVGAYKKSYAEALRRREANNKVPIPDAYPDYLKKTRIYLSVLAAMAAVQTAMPEVEVRKTYPGCSRNMTDWPLNQDESKLGTIAYFACVTRKMHESGADAGIIPKASFIQKMLVSMFTTVQTVVPDVGEAYARKREYLLARNIGLNVSANIPVEVNVAVRWPQFMPPTFPVVVPANQLVQSTGPGSGSGSKTDPQTRAIVPLDAILNARISAFTVAVVQYIREYVKTQAPLRASRDGLPFVDNACCEARPAGEGSTVTTLQYFEREDDTVKLYVAFLQKLGTVLSRVTRYQIAPTGIVALPIVARRVDPATLVARNSVGAYSTDMMYLALIKFCHLDSTILPIPDDLVTICAEKPSDRSATPFPLSAPLNEQIAYLNQNNVHMSADRMISMMNIIFRRHPVRRAPTPTLTPIGNVGGRAIRAHKRLSEYCARFPSVCADLIKVKAHLDAILGSSGDTKAEDELAAYIQTQNTKETASMKSYLRSALKERLSVVDRQTGFLSSLAGDMFSDSVPVDTIRNYAVFVADQFGMVFPSDIATNFAEDRKPSVPKHWALLPADEGHLKLNLRLPTNSRSTAPNSGTVVPMRGNPILKRVAIMVIARYKVLRKFIREAVNIYWSGSTLLYATRIKEMYLFLVYQVLKLFRTLVTTDAQLGRDIQAVVQELNQQGIRYTERPDDPSQAEQLIDTDRAEYLLTDAQNQAGRMVANYMWAALGTLRTRQRGSEAVTMSYTDIIREVDFSRDREKQKVKDYFKAMSTDARKLEMTMKANHLGAWAVATSKLNKYGAQENLFGQRDEDEGGAVDTGPMEYEDSDDEVERNEPDTQTPLDEDADNLNNESDEDDTRDIMDNAYDVGYEYDN